MSGEMARAYFQEPDVFIPGYYMIDGQEFHHPPIVWLETWDEWCEHVDNNWAKYGLYRVEWREVVDD